ncbi:PorP/SprF family type IX secretion system membrane protein [uncultured Eudoraea sp.]|jgi:type IX secretion system PorP/SprF family membrane protein|uniref:PorP/SprF family type IX secretion system membrane protein n=1 Tax=uncultured Eudoraea sp. TaxID=1035614 RepID=UPI00260DA565|nr:PorP/SprF family type IX secretion system membrane protein [uncultured Eudoraea sp.]
MLKKALFFFMVLTVLSVKSQEPELPYDFRQHNLTEFNSSLLSPVFSLDRNNPQSVALWTRWQWQTMDSSPTTLFLNYSRKLNEESAIGGGFLQHNTGVFVNTGGVLNYAYNFVLNSKAQITLGINAIGYQRKLAEEFIMDPGLPIFEEKSNFILQIAPAVKLQLNAFSFGIAMENLLDRNLTTNEGNASATGLIYMGLASYDFPVTIFGDSSTSYIRPTLYYKRLPDFDNQIGLNTFFSTPKFWAQVGYNNFYGISTGIGGHFFKKLSLGALVEFGTSADIKGEDPSFEIVTAFSFGQQVFEVEELEDLETEQQQINEELAVLEAQRKQDSLAAVKAAEILALEQLQNQKSKDSIAIVRQQIELAKAQELAETKRKDSIALVNQQIELAKAQELAETKRKDSIRMAKEAIAIAAIKAGQEKSRIDSLNAVKQAEALAEARKLREKNMQDSINALEEEKAIEEVVVLKKGEVYEEVASEEGLEPGYYLIANVFGTKKYFEAFVKKLSAEGLQPKSFYRAKNKYNYVYLKRYDSMQEARNARDSKYGGRYDGKTWIYRVIGK